jgi:PPM family protein phosphatase
VTVLRSGSATDVGRRRQVNEDLPLESANLFAVADGMGGHVGGEVAARVAVDALLESFTRVPTTDGLEEAFADANRAVWQEGQDHNELRGMGTTLTAMALVGGDDGHDTLALANVGDSRAYVFSEGQVVQITADHSLAEERMRHGEMTEAEAAVHPQRHILTRALGVYADVEADMWHLKLRSGDRVVLCTDGLSNELELAEMADVLATVHDPTEAARQLVDAANDHGGADNITAVVVDVLVGEEQTGTVSVVTPIGERAGAPLVISNGGGTGPVTAATAKPDTLARGAQLGFTPEVSRLTGDDPGSDEFFLGHTQAVPVARATARATVPARVQPEEVPSDESRHERRRRLGIPRRITLRVIAFTLLVAAVPVGAFLAIRWYAYDNWFLSIRGNQVVVQQGHPGGVLWLNPRIVDHTGVTTKQLLPTGVAQIRSGVQEPSLADAKRYVANLHGQYVFLKAAAAKAKKAAESTTTTLAPSAPTNSATTTTTTTPTAVSTTVPVTSAVPTTAAAAIVTTTTSAP